MTKMNKKSGIVILVFLLLVSLPLFAGDEARLGTAAGVQVLVPVGARDIAMNGSDIVFTKGVDAIYWNPAGLSNMSNTASGTFSTITIFNDVKVNYLAVGASMGSLGHIGFSIKSFDFGDIPVTTVTDMDGDAGQIFSPTFTTMGLTYANKLTSSIQVGMTAKLIYESIPRAAGTAVAFDIGIQYQNLAGIEGVSFGVAAKNIGSSLQYNGTALQTKATGVNSSKQEFLDRSASEDQLPASLELGLSYKYNVMDKSDLVVSGVFQSNNIENDYVKMGMEYMFDNFVAVRAGYLYMTNTDAEDQLYSFALGAGIQYEVGGTMLGLDYAFRDSQYFDANNMFSLRVAF